MGQKRLVRSAVLVGVFAPITAGLISLEHPPAAMADSVYYSGVPSTTVPAANGPAGPAPVQTPTELPFTGADLATLGGLALGATGLGAVLARRRPGRRG